MKSAGGVEDDEVLAAPDRLGDCLERDLNRRAGAGMECDPLALGQQLQLLNRRRPPQVESSQQRALAVLPGHERELDRGGRLARSLEADQHQHGRRPSAVLEPFRVAAQDFGQLVVDHFDDLLGGGEAGAQLGAGEQGLVAGKE